MNTNDSRRQEQDRQNALNTRNREQDRQNALNILKQEPCMEHLWDAIVLYAGQPFHTYNGLEFSYTVKGGELFFSRKEKSITKSTVEIAYRKAEELGWIVTGPKKLGVFGASYLYPVFLGLGIIRTKI